MRRALLGPLALLAPLVLLAPAAAGPQPTQPVPTQAAAAGDARPAYEAAMRALAAKEVEEAKRQLLAALRADERHVPSQLRLAEIAYQQRNETELKRWLALAERTAPDDVRVLTTVGRFYLLRDQVPQGEALLKRAAEIDAKALEPRVDLADALLRRKAAAEALPWLQQAVALAPQRPELHLRLGDALLRTGQVPQGQAALRQAAQLDPKAAQALVLLAASQTQPAESLKLLDEALKREPQHPGGWMLRAAYQFQVKDLAGARTSLERAAQADPKAAEPWARLGMMADEAQQTREARNYYLQALQRDAGHPVALNNLAMLQLKANEDPAQAEAMVRRALKTLPQQAQIHDTLARALVARKQKDGALAAVREAARLAPQDADIQLHLAEIQLLNGDREAARRTTEALRGRPGVDAERLARLLARLG